MLWGVMGSRHLNVANYPVFEKPELEQFTFDVGCSQFHIMLRQMQRDMGMISDHEMGIAEHVMSGSLACVNDANQTLFNPLTGEVDKRLLRERQKLWR